MAKETHLFANFVGNVPKTENMSSIIVTLLFNFLFLFLFICFSTAVGIMQKSQSYLKVNLINSCDTFRRKQTMRQYISPYSAAVSSHYVCDSSSSIKTVLCAPQSLLAHRAGHVPVPKQTKKTTTRAGVLLISLLQYDARILQYFLYLLIYLRTNSFS
jgi:hypothetical protein